MKIATLQYVAVKNYFQKPSRVNIVRCHLLVCIDIYVESTLLRDIYSYYL